MFHTSTHALALGIGRPQHFAQAYHRVGVETGVAAASPHRLIAMLFDGYMAALAEATGALRDGRIEAKGRALGRAVRIVDEGLRGGLDLQGGGALAADLNELYHYLMLRLTQANLRNDAAAIDECQKLMTPLRDAWAAIADRPEAARRGPGSA